MKACARAAGADRIAPAATAAAIDLEMLSITLPRIWPGNWTGEAARSTPSERLRRSDGEEPFEARRTRPAFRAGNATIPQLHCGEPVRQRPFLFGRMLQCLLFVQSDYPCEFPCEFPCELPWEFSWGRPS